MLNEKRISLAQYRLKSAWERYDAALLLYEEGKYKDATNRAYYSIFSGLRAILALEAKDFKKHSGAISYFRQNYIKIGIFSDELSDIIGSAFFIRNQSDYVDFFIVSREDARVQCDNALKFIETIAEYLQPFIFPPTP